MSGRFSAVAASLLPQKLSGRFVYRISRSRKRWLKNLLIRGFCRLYDVDLTEAESADCDAFACFNDFFTRPLKSGARPLEGDESVLASPADGTLTEFGQLDGRTLLQAKDRRYTVEALLAEAPELLEAFHGGSYLTVYLAPHNYHRVHAPLAGMLDRARYIPGRRYSVNANTAARIDSLYARNERVALWLSTAFGYVVVVMVGALNVASLSTALTGEIESGHEQLISTETELKLARGEELGRFNLGSTVVVLFPHGSVTFDGSLEPGAALRVGQAVGRATAPAAA